MIVDKPDGIECAIEQERTGLVVECWEEEQEEEQEEEEEEEEEENDDGDYNARKRLKGFLDDWLID